MNPNGKRKVAPQTKEELKEIIQRTLQEEGDNANLNFIGVSHITDMKEMLSDSKFKGEIHKWNVRNLADM